MPKASLWNACVLLVMLLSMNISSFTSTLKFFTPPAPGNQAIKGTTTSSSDRIGGCPVFPANNIWNYDISNLPVAANSANYVNSMGLTGPLTAYFGATVPGYAPPGIPFATVPSTQPYVPVQFYYADQSDAGPYPIPPNVPIEGGKNGTNDRHVLVIDKGTCKLYEMYNAFPQKNGSWSAGSGAVWDLKSNQLRPLYWTSADAAGLPIFPALARYDEVAAGLITHALRVTTTASQCTFLWPARHIASTNCDTNLPPMGLRLRLKASVDISSFPPDVQVILTALKHYGMFVADNGPRSWVVSGAPNSHWNNTDLASLNKIQGSDFEAVDESALQLSQDSGEVNTTFLASTSSQQLRSNSSAMPAALSNSPFAFSAMDIWQKRSLRELTANLSHR